MTDVKIKEESREGKRVGISVSKDQVGGRY